VKTWFSENPILCAIEFQKLLANNTNRLIPDPVDEHVIETLLLLDNEKTGASVGDVAVAPKGFAVAAVLRLSTSSVIV